MQVEVILPDLDGGNMTVFTVETWLCSEGSKVIKDEPLLQVRSGVTLHVIPSPEAGTVVVRRVKAGATVRKGAVLGVLEMQGPSS